MPIVDEYLLLGGGEILASEVKTRDLYESRNSDQLDRFFPNSQEIVGLSGCAAGCLQRVLTQ